MTESPDNIQHTNKTAQNHLFLITVALLIGAIAALWFWHFQETPDPASNETPRQNPNRQTPKATVIPQSIPDQTYQTPATKSIDTDKMFTTYFFATPSELFPAAAGRRGEPQPAFFRLYDAGKFSEALAAFPADQKDDTWLYFKAICLLKTGKLKEAAALFEGIIIRGTTNFSSYSHWYLGLANLKMNNIEEARKSLQLYLIETDVRTKVTVRRLLQELR